MIHLMMANMRDRKMWRHINILALNWKYIQLEISVIIFHTGRIGNRQIRKIYTKHK